MSVGRVACIVLLGCAEADGDATCKLPLTDYCDVPCPTFDEAVASAREGTGRQHVHVQVRECGTTHTSIHYVDIDGLYGTIEWFDASGTLVGAMSSDDDLDACDERYGGWTWGDDPQCEPGCVIETIPYCGEDGDACTPADYVHVEDCGGGVSG